MKNTLTFFAFFVLSSLFVNGQNIQEKATLHYIVFATTNDGTIGSGNSRSLELLSDVVTQIAEANIIDSIARYEFFNDDFTETNLDTLIYTLRKSKAIKKNDIIFFYFLGHGINNGNYISPDLAFQGGSKTTDENTPTQNLENIGFKLIDLGARLTLTFAESCNNFPNDSPIIENKSGSSIVSAPNMGSIKKKRLSDLFLYSKGYVIMSSSDLNQFSLVHQTDGGIFTQVFCKNIFKHIDKVNANINWRDLLGNVEKDVVAFTKKLKYNTKQVQQPFYYDISLIQDIPPKNRVETAARVSVLSGLMSKFLNKKNVTSIKDISDLSYALTPEKRQRHHKENPFAYYMTQAILAEYNGQDKKVFIYYSIAKYLYDKGIKEENDDEFVKKLQKLDKDYLEFGFTKRGITYNKWIVTKLESYSYINKNNMLEKNIQKIKDNIVRDR